MMQALFLRQVREADVVQSIMDVVGIGQCAWDYLAVVDGYPAPDTKQEACDWQEQGGGPVATALVALRRLGLSCRFHGVVGDDEAGGRIVRSIEGERVDASAVRTRDGAASQTAFIAVDKATGGRTIFWRRPTGRPRRSC